MRHLDLKEDQILAIPLAGDLPGQDLSRDSDNAQNLDELNITSPYILYPARNWPHKRHDLLLSVMREISLARDDLQLVLTGWHDEGAISDLARKCEVPREKIVELNYVSDAQMIFLYRNAEALMFVSEYEGFGMPILEAMQNGCPVICAPLTSIPEVAGDAALYVASDDPKNWAKAFLEDLPPQRKSLIQKGYQQAQKFSWGHTQSLWRELIETQLEKITPQTFLPLPYLQEMQGWAERYKTAQDEMWDKEKVIRALGNQNQNLQEQVAAKEAIIGFFRTSSVYALQNSPIRALPFMRFALPVLSRLRDLRRAFLPKVGVLEQHTPAPLSVPEHYNIFPVVDPAQAPRISIVTPSYQQAAFIERTAKSVLDQGYPNLEYVVQDGGSTDGTVEVMKPYLDRLKHFESRKDRGQAHAINLGMKHASGEIMAYLNSDDILLPGSLNYVADYFLKHPEVGVIYSHRVIINEKDEEIGRWILPRHDNDVILWADYVPQETLFWRCSVWEKAGNQMDESYQFALDWDMLVRFRNTGAKIVRVPRFLAAFRVQSAQKTSMHMSSTGLEEMNRLRSQIHNREIDWEEILKNIKPYLNRSVVYHKLYWLGVLRY
jgi:glycosyltransferase involved in cell wall biosynthesis